MYALKCANSVPQPTAPISVDTRYAADHSASGWTWRGTTRRRHHVTATTISAAATTIVIPAPIGGNDVPGSSVRHRMFVNDFQNRSMLKSCARWILDA